MILGALSRRQDEVDRLHDDAPRRAREYGSVVNGYALPRAASWLAAPLSFGEVAPPVLLAVWVQFDVWASGPPLAFGHMVGPRALVTALYAVTSLVLIWRRRAPLAVLAFIAIADSVFYLVYGAPEGLGSFLPLLIAFYAVGRYAPTRSVAPAAALTAMAMFIHEATDPQFAFGGANAFFWLVLASGWPIGHAFRRRVQEAADLAGHARQLAAERDQMAQAAVEGERARIARELHDVVGHGLSVIVLQLVAAQALIEGGDTAGAGERISSTERSARDALAEMRRLLDLLDDGAAPPRAPQPGLTQAERLVSDTCNAGAEVDLEITGTPVNIPTGIDLAAFRILQESLTNVLKHARPPRAHVRVAYQRDAVVVDVRDEGQVLQDTGSAGRGLAGMRERVALYGGELDLGPQPGGGFLVHARIPVPT
jgi:signal transduction histidine kinase